nr:hypothetical protein [Tanacetum cinerariifolium]
SAGTSSASDAPTDFGEPLDWRVLRETLCLILLALAGLSVVLVAYLLLFSCVLAGTDVGAGCVDVTEDEIEGFGGAFWSCSNVCRNESTRNRHPEDFSLSSFGTEFEVSKNRLFIGQVEWRVGSWVEPVLPLKMVGGGCKGPEEVGVL